MVVEIDTSALTKGEIRKLESLRKFLGDEIADEAFAKWLVKRTYAVQEQPDPTIVTLQSLLEGHEDLKLGNWGYTIMRAKGKHKEAGAFLIRKNLPPTGTKKEPAGD